MEAHRNLYAPPKARVESATTRSRPAEVSWAVALLWIGFALDTVSAGLSTQDPRMRGAFQDLVGESTVMLAVALALIALLFVLSAFLIYMIGRGRNWARIGFLALTLVLVLPSVPFDPLDFTDTLGVIDLVSIFLCAIAFILLFATRGRAWFKRVPASS